MSGKKRFEAMNIWQNIFGEKKQPQEEMSSIE